MAKGKHMTQEQRDTILIEIKKGTSLKEIAEKVGKDPTSISKEIRKHRYIKEMTRGDYTHPYCCICSKTKECSKKKYLFFFYLFIKIYRCILCWNFNFI